MSRILDLVKIGLLAGLLTVGLLLVTGTPIKIRLPANDILLLQPVTDPLGQPGIIGEQITISPDGSIEPKVGK